MAEEVVSWNNFFQAHMKSGSSCTLANQLKLAARLLPTI